MSENEEPQAPKEPGAPSAAPETGAEPHPFDMSERRDFGVVLALLAIVAIVAAAAVVFMRKGGPTGERPSEAALAPDVAARVGTRDVTMQEFKIWLASLPQSVQVQIGSPEGRRAILGQYLNRIAIDEYARAQGVYETEAFKKEFEEMRSMFAVRELVEETFKAQASEDDLRDFYNKRREQFPKKFDDPSQRYQLIDEYRRTIVSNFADIFLRGITIQKAKEFNEPVIAQMIYSDTEKDVLTLEDWESELAGLSTDQQRWSATPEGREEILQRILRRKALARIALMRDYGKRPSVETGLAEIKPHIAARVLSLDELKDVDPIVDEEIKNNRSAYEETRMEIAHILIRLPADAQGAEEATVKNKIQDIYDQLQKKPGDFASVAAEVSQDAGSAEKGGVLGEVGKSELIAPLADAAFKLKKDEISKPVRTIAGYHVVKALTDPVTQYDEGVARAMARRRIMEAAMETKIGEIVTKVGVTVNNQAIESWDPLSQFLEEQARAAQAGPMPGSPPASPAEAAH